MKAVKGEADRGAFVRRNFVQAGDGLSGVAMNEEAEHVGDGYAELDALLFAVGKAVHV